MGARFIVLFGKPAMRTRWMDGTAHHKSKYTDDHRGQLIADVISNSDHITLNTNTPTRVPNTTLQQTSSSDITTVSNTLYNRTSWPTQHALSSDHLPILTTINIRHDYRLQQTRQTFTNYKKADWTQFTEESAFAQTNIHTAKLIFTNIILMTDKHNIQKSKMHSNCRLLPDHIVCKITQRKIKVKSALNTNIIPHIWKLANIVPIPKPNKEIDKGTSYRPISLLSVIAKTLEKSLLAYITSNTPNTPTQHGYKTQHSIVTALHTVNNTVAKGFNQRDPPVRTIAVALDVSKAFDTINKHRCYKPTFQTQSLSSSQTTSRDAKSTKTQTRAPHTDPYPSSQ